MNLIKISAANFGTAIKTLQSDMMKKAIRAGINTVNIQAAQTRKNAIEFLQDNMILRNNFTVRNIIYTQCKKTVTNISDIQSEVGASDRIDYMVRQEKGGPHKPASGTTLAIPTTQARGGSNNQTIRKKYRLNTLERVSGTMTHTGTQKSRAVARAYVAARNNKVLNYSKGMYTVTNFTASNGAVNFNMHLIYNKKFQTTQTKATQWLEKSAEEPGQDCQQIFNQQMDLQFK